MAAKLSTAAVIAFNELEYNLIGAQRLNVPRTIEGLPSKVALFVTWTKKGALRACIGTFTPQPIVEGIRTYATVSAFEDPRFKPIDAKELPDLEVSVTLLGPLELIHNPSDWTIGLHGIKAVFDNKATSTFLPDVMVEQGWTKEQTMKELAAKAGIERTKNITLYRYEGKKVKISYKDYKLVSK